MWAHHQYRTLSSMIPNHLQMVGWFDDSSVKTLFTILKPHWSWSSLWKKRNEMDLFPKKGLYLWVFWNASLRRRDYICIRYECLKELFQECRELNELTNYHDKAIIDRLQRYVHGHYQKNSKKHCFIEIQWKKTPLIKRLQVFKESLYVTNNIKGKDLLKLYQFLHGENIEDEEHPHFLITNDDLEETILLKDDFLIV
jgi:hypothetical protein